MILQIAANHTVIEWRWDLYPPMQTPGFPLLRLGRELKGHEVRLVVQMDSYHPYVGFRVSFRCYIVILTSGYG